MKIDNEMKVIAILSGYMRELYEGKDYTETTLKIAKTIVEICSVENNQKELLISFARFMESEFFSDTAMTPEQLVSEFEKSVNKSI